MVGLVDVVLVDVVVVKDGVKDRGRHRNTTLVVGTRLVLKGLVTRN